jgi:hypothetical protein
VHDIWEPSKARKVWLDISLYRTDEHDGLVVMDTSDMLDQFEV